MHSRDVPDVVAYTDAGTTGRSDRHRVPSRRLLRARADEPRRVRAGGAGGRAGGRHDAAHGRQPAGRRHRAVPLPRHVLEVHRPWSDGSDRDRRGGWVGGSRPPACATGPPPLGGRHPPGAGRESCTRHRDRPRSRRQAPPPAGCDRRRDPDRGRQHRHRRPRRRLRVDRRRRRRGRARRRAVGDALVAAPRARPVGLEGATA